MRSMTVLLADDHRLVRSGLRSLLESIHGITIAGETGDGREALDLIARLHPDIALLDVTMPGLNGLEVAARVADVSPGTRVVILTMHAGETYVAQALRAGAAAYLLKDSAVSELEAALEAVSAGGTYLSPAVSGPVKADSGASPARLKGEDSPPVPGAQPGELPAGDEALFTSSPGEAPRQGEEPGAPPEAWLELTPSAAQGLIGITAGDELLVLTWLHLAQRDVLQVHPRGDVNRPLTGVFATRSPDRPNPVGLHRVRVLEVIEQKLRVAALEAIDGTPIIDIKPVLAGSVSER